MTDIAATLALGPVIPVVTLSRAEDALSLAEALLAGGIRTIEITLRTPAGLEGIRALANAGLDMAIGAGTVTTPDLLKQATDAGAEFLVSPGLTETLATAANGNSAPLLPGIASVSEAMQAAEWGFTHLKFFPASVSGGPAMLKNLGAVLPNLRFCPTGGISLQSMGDYLSLPNVVCVGGSWLTPADAMQSGNWGAITVLASEASAPR